MFHPERLGLCELFLVLLLRDLSSAPPLHGDAALGRLRIGAVERGDCDESGENEDYGYHGYW